MNKIIVTSGLVLFALLMQVTCLAATPAIYDQNTKAITLTKAQPVFSIKLVSNPTTGYTWSLKDYDKALLTSTKHQFYPPKTGLIGAPGYELWTFRVKPSAFSIAAQTNLIFDYARPWEHESVKSVELKLIIKK